MKIGSRRPLRKSVDIRPATAADFIDYFGKPPHRHWFGLAAVHDGRVVGLGGVAWLDEGAHAFLDCPQCFMPPPLRAHKLARHLLGIARKAGEPDIFVVPTPGIATAKKWLGALGFVFDHMRASSEVWKLCQD